MLAFLKEELQASSVLHFCVYKLLIVSGEGWEGMGPLCLSRVDHSARWPCFSFCLDMEGFPAENQDFSTDFGPALYMTWNFPTGEPVCYSWSFLLAWSHVPGTSNWQKLDKLRHVGYSCIWPRFCVSNFLFLISGHENSALPFRDLKCISFPLPTCIDFEAHKTFPKHNVLLNIFS